MTPAPGIAPGRALAALAADPGGLGGLWLRARPGPVRDAVCGWLAALGLDGRRVPHTVSDSQLFGGLDLAQTISSGHKIDAAGLLAGHALVTLPMAERIPAGLAARLAAWADAPEHAFVAIDEGADADEALPPALADRAGVFLWLDGMRHTDLGPPPCPDTVRTARDRRDGLVTEAVIAAAVQIAAHLGVGGVRAPMATARMAAALAALDAADGVEERHLAEAAALCLAHRAGPDSLPEPGDPPAEEASTDPGEDGDTGESLADPADRLIEAVAAALPAGLLGSLAAATAPRGAVGSGAGDSKTGNRRGRPLPSRPGRPGGDARVDLVATLRTAAPWQALRSRTSPRGQHVRVHTSDIRIRRFEERSDRLIVFAVDASGSAAVARLNEAKGAIEHLLAEAYARRDHVALVAFRGDGAEVLLPATRSLVQTKRRLTALPGGGGTPLAAGLRSALDTALHARRQGYSPAVVLLTDGRANVALDGAQNRIAAAADADVLADALRQHGIPGLVVDTGRRRHDRLHHLAERMGSAYVALPHADAARLSHVVTDNLTGR